MSSLFPTKMLFGKFSINTEFFKENPASWNKINSFNMAKNTVCLLKVVYDVAERTVMMMEDYHSVLTKDEQ